MLLRLLFGVCIICGFGITLYSGLLGVLLVCVAFVLLVLFIAVVDIVGAV